MADIYKRCEAWVIALQSDIFNWAKIKLTGLYLIVIVVILAVFSFALRANLAHHLRTDLNIRRAIESRDADGDGIDDAPRRIDAVIGATDIAVLLIAGGFSYWLAGYTLKPIRKALDAQSRFSAEASHELRTPLAVMLTSIEVLLRSSHALPREARDVLESNLEEIKSMSKMTEQLLELSRGRNFMPEKLERLNLTDVVRGMIEKLNKLAARKGILLISGESAGVFVNGKTDDLERILKNIITNSITYTPRGGIITVSVFNKRGRAEILVADTGIGIAPKDLPHIFKAFYKADQSRAAVDNQSGAGLGLAIVKQIVEQHRGAIEVKSLVNKGTMVIVRIPSK